MNSIRKKIIGSTKLDFLPNPTWDLMRKVVNVRCLLLYPRSMIKDEPSTL